MGLRRSYGSPEGPSFGALGDFLLEPSAVDAEASDDEDQTDRLRLAVFDVVAGIEPLSSLSGQSIPAEAANAADAEGGVGLNPTARALFDRLRELHPIRRMLILKAAAEWVLNRYRRALEHREFLLQSWQAEKAEWERQHIKVPAEDWATACDQLTEVFRSLPDPEAGDRPGIRRRNPRICRFERLQLNIDNCAYGERGHGPLCWKYATFQKVCCACGKSRERGRQLNKSIRELMPAHRFGDEQVAAVTRLIESGHGHAFNKKFFEKHFPGDVARYIESRRSLQTKQGQRGQPHQLALDSLYRNKPPQQAKQFRQRFNAVWRAYLQCLGVNESTVLDSDAARGPDRLPHCIKIGATGSESKCSFNKHTELCSIYRKKLLSLPESTQQLEGDYREWRRLGFLAPPRKPSFRYPSSRDLPTPKIFGKGFFKVDFVRSVVALRLEDSPDGDWLEFAFVPWPRKYDQKRDVTVTSVHLHFVGSRARLGFRFAVRAQPSRLQITQDTLDDLRRQYRRASQRRTLLSETRTALETAFAGKLETELRILAVDLGEKGAAAAVYQGRTHEADVPLRITKLEKRYPLPTGAEVPDGAVEQAARDGRHGLTKEHVAHHLIQFAAATRTIVQARQTPAQSLVTLERDDLRGLQLHVKWMIRDWVRHNASQIVAVAEQHQCDLIVFEDLRQITVPGYDALAANDQREKRSMSVMSFGRIRGKVTEKAVERGMRVVTVPEFRSSRVCAECGHDQCAESWQEKRWRENKLKRGEFHCMCGAPPPKGKNRGMRESKDERESPKCACQFRSSSDVNAARCVARILLGEIVPSEPEP